MKVSSNESQPVVPEQGSDTNRPRSAEEESLRKVSQSFESLLVNQMVGEMRKTISRASLVPQSQSEKIFQGMLDNEYSQKISQSEQIGLSKMIYDHLLRRYRGG